MTGKLLHDGSEPRASVVNAFEDSSNTTKNATVAIDDVTKSGQSLRELDRAAAGEVRSVRVRLRDAGADRGPWNEPLTVSGPS